jgi:branched-chain amino acid transport system substrate-binding protein
MTNNVILESCVALNSKAITKIQTIILLAIIVIAALAGVIYVLLNEKTVETETIKIGICADLDRLAGESIWQGAQLAAEHVNAEGGVLGRQIELIGEDSDEEDVGMDPTKINTAFTKLITYHKVDFILGGLFDQSAIVMQDIAAQHKKIYFTVSGGGDILTQRVADNYDKYKYYFRTTQNSTSSSRRIVESLVTLREYTGFNKLAYLAEDRDWTERIRTDVDAILAEEYGFQVVYRGVFMSGTVDFTSYFAQAEAAGAEIMIPLTDTDEGISLTKEWCERQSPMVLWGMNIVAGSPNYCEITEGKCEFETSCADAVSMGYPMSNETLPMYTAFIDKWGYPPVVWPIKAYDIIRFVLPDAIERAGTIETEAVIKALEETDIETASFPHFRFTQSHDLLVTESTILVLGQWQNGEIVPVYPKEIMEEAGATYIFPDWPGPWEDLS